ncbi:MAG: hypothetical protein J6S85_01710 [Methanobrevibacter sp.]|nr:hypothetical protein [Methanobrevibacter sp.]MBO7712251.1 hypothetical protein [Methanobrevibacter sp.]
MARPDLLDNCTEIADNDIVMVTHTNGITETITGANLKTQIQTKVKGNSESTYRTGEVNITKTNIGLGNVANTGDSATPVSGGTTKFTTGGAYTELAKKVNTTSVGAANGVASLDSSGKVPSNQLPSYVDDVLEYTAKADFPETGETGKIYVDKTTNKSWRWSGSAYIELSSYAEATTSASGLMSAADKTKLNGIESSANNYVHPTTAGNKHIPSGGSSGQYLKYSSSGTATWAGITLSDSDKNTIFDMVHPIGEIYVQFPTQTAPQTLYGKGTWTEVTSTYAGLFFRAAGGNAGTFGTSSVIKQAEGLPNITGSITSSGYSLGANISGDTTNTGALKGEEFNKKTASGSSTNATYMSKISLDASNGNTTVPDGASTGKIYGNSNHVTPVNTAIKIWKRTA